MDLKILIDRDSCDGYGNCLFVAPEIFDLDDENKVILLTEDVTDENSELIDLAINECPMRAIATGPAKA